MNVLVIGGSGFIGTRLVEALVGLECSVTIFDKEISKDFPDKTIVGDVRDLSSLIDATSKIDVIYNLAAEHKDNVSPESLYEEVNVGGAKNIVEAARINSVRRIVFTSSVAIYGLDVGIPDENFLANPFNKYGESKLAAEEIFFDWANSQERNSLLVVRPVVIFGEGNRGNVYNLLKAINGQNFRMVGSGNNKKSMGYVRNIAAFLAYIRDKEEGVFNYSDGPDMSTKELVELTHREMGINQIKLSVPYPLALPIAYCISTISGLMRRPTEISPIRIRKFCASTQVSSVKLEKINFGKPFSLVDGLKRTISHEFS